MKYIILSQDTFHKGEEPWYFGTTVVDDVEADRPFSAEEFIRARHDYGRALGFGDTAAEDAKISVTQCDEDGTRVTVSTAFLSFVHEKHGWGEVEHICRPFRPRVKPSEFGDAAWCVPNWYMRRVTWRDIHEAQAEREAERQAWHAFFAEFLHGKEVQ